MKVISLALVVAIMTMGIVQAAPIVPPANGSVAIGGYASPTSNEKSCGGLAAALGKKALYFCNSYFSFNALGSSQAAQTMSSELKAGTIPLIALGCTDKNFTQLTKGAYDKELLAAAKNVVAMKKYGNGQIMIRTFWEMNENVGMWISDPNGNNCYTPTFTTQQKYAEFIAGFQYVVTLFRKAGADNVTWLFCPALGQEEYYPTHMDTDLAKLFPGKQYVDYTCTDAYDKPAPGEGGLHALAYVSALKQFGLPIIIAETSECSATHTGHCNGYLYSQAAFWNDIANALKPGGSLAGIGIAAIGVFDTCTHQCDPTNGTPWQFDAAGLAALKQLIANGSFV